MGGGVGVGGWGWGGGGGGGGGWGGERIRKQVYVFWICIIYNNYGYPLLHCG